MKPRDHVLVLVNSEYADTPYDVWARAAGVIPHLFVAADKAAGYAGIEHVEVFENYRVSGLIEKRALALAKEAPLAVIVARGEVDILRAAELRAALSIPGQMPDSAIAYRHKIRMKEYLVRAGVQVSEYAAADSAVELLAFIARTGYPIVVKPVLGSGSADTHVLRGEDDLDALLARGLRDRYVAERFVAGDMYHVDGLVTGGRIVEIHPSKYYNDCLSFQRGEFLGSYPIAASDPLHDRLTSFVRRMVAALPGAECMTFHGEVFHTPSDELVACEIASRTSGGRTNQMLAAAFGTNLDEQWFLAQCGGAAIVPRTNGHGRREYGQVLIYPRVGTLVALPAAPRPAWVEQERLVGRPGQRFEGGVKSGDVVAAYVVEGSSVEELIGRFHDIATWFDGQVQWSP